MRNKLRLEGLTLSVENVAKSLEFYSGILGLEVAYHAEPAFALVKVGDVSIGLLAVEESRKEGALDTTPGQKQAIHVEFSTDDLDAAYTELLAAGVRFHAPPHDEPWERAMTAFDPDGYAVEIAQGRRGESGEIWNPEK